MLEWLDLWKHCLKWCMLSFIYEVSVMLSVVMLSVIMLSVIMLSVIMLSVVMLSSIMLSVVMLSVVAHYKFAA